MGLKRKETLRIHDGELGGKLPPPLMQLEVLPICYQIDEPFDTKDTEEAFEGRRQRRRNIVMIMVLMTTLGPWCVLQFMCSIP
jgi:hypothetical protein